MPRIYGPALASVYERHWSGFAQKAGPAIARLLRAVGIESGRVVDLGCGQGHVAAALSRRGFDVLGIDRSRAMVALARGRAPRARFRVTRLERARLPRRVSAVTSTYDTLNYVTRPADLGRLFRRVHGSLVPGGVFVFDMDTPLMFQRHHGTARVRRTRDIVLVAEFHYDAASRLGRSPITSFAREGDRYVCAREEHVQRAYEPSEIERLLEGAGFGWERLGHYWENPDVKSQERVFYLARRRMPRR